MQPNPGVQVFLKRFVRYGAIAGFAVGCAGLIGWAFNIAPLKSVFPGLAIMKANTALAFACVSAALVFLNETEPDSKLFWAGRVLAGLAAAIGAATLCEYIFHWDLRIDQLLFSYGPDSFKITYPGRMTPAASLNFLLLGLALLSLRARSAVFGNRQRWLAAPVHMMGTLALLGYAYSVRSLYGVVLFSSMALHTSLTFWLLSLCVFLSDSSRGFMKIVASDSIAGEMARSLLPAIPVIVFSSGIVCLAGEQAGLFDGRFGLAIMTVLCIAVLASLTAWLAMALYRADLKRAQMEAEIRSLNATLEQRVAERTLELENSLTQVRQLGGMLPICSYCKKVRDDQDYWHSVESYVALHSGAQFSHSICPACFEHLSQKYGLTTP